MKHNLKFKYIKKNLISDNNINYSYKKSLSKPSWIKVKLPSDFSTIHKIEKYMKEYNINSVCKEALCPNIAECFNNGTATFMILGKLCTRICTFCAVKHGKPLLPNHKEPDNIANIVNIMNLKYVVITSVTRDDLKDGGVNQFTKCIKKIRNLEKSIKIEILVPDFRGCVNYAIEAIRQEPPDVFNHNLENVPRLYKQIRPHANYKNSLNLLKKFKKFNPNVITKSGLMLGLGETLDEIINVMYDLRSHGVSMITLGQYLQPSKFHLPVYRYLLPEEFNLLYNKAKSLGFIHAFCGPFVRSSYNADLQHKN
ncbi:lipoyl synthase [Buchnera aphidicola (Neophyllaphis podocarpi)]|uniref:lipoyl synthase n=1 Tax=Buchnera aphidicola TaxID=9 RepID=UPI0031B8319F